MRTVLYAHEMDPVPKGREAPVLWGFYPSIFTTRLARGSRTNPIHKVVVTPAVVTTADPEESAPAHWAWWDLKYEEFRHVYYFKDLVRMCFPYGTDAAEEAGQGWLMGVEVDLVCLVPDEEPDERKIGKS